MTDPAVLDKLSDGLRRAAIELDRDGIQRIRLLSAKYIVMAVLDDIDRALHYGNPGAGLDELLSKKEDET